VQPQWVINCDDSCLVIVQWQIPPATTALTQSFNAKAQSKQRTNRKENAKTKQRYLFE
jgi:predicted DNA-binding WGR domain protein